MKVGVVGLFHLGCVTAACLANAGHDVVAFDPSAEVINNLKKGNAPIYEPGLDALLPKVKFTADLQDLSNADIVWITYDTPVDENDIADVNYVMQEIKKLMPQVHDNALMLISSQLPVGSTRKLQQYCSQQFPTKNISFACSPENLRLGKAIQVFTNPDRVVVGLDQEQDKAKIQALLKPFTTNIIWMSIESAEMTKHALNAFLATSVVFINELAVICEQVGADAREVEMGLKSEERIGKKAYLRPGNAIAGGTLARDVNYLTQIGREQQFDTHLFSSLLASNQQHKQWISRKLLQLFTNLQNKKITALGLTYKAGTDTLRRSTAVELCKWLSEQGAVVTAYDPVVKSLPSDINFIELKSNIQDALHQSDAVVVSTEWPEFSSLNADHFINQSKQPFIIDPSGFLNHLSQDKKMKYFSVGRSQL